MNIFVKEYSTKINTNSKKQTMKKIFLLLAISCLIISCSTTKRVSVGTTNHESVSVTTQNDGSSYIKAIEIKVKGEFDGVKAEYKWLGENYPGYKSKEQMLVFNNNKPYDIIKIITATGEEKSIYFDISYFYGKF